MNIKSLHVVTDINDTGNPPSCIFPGEKEEPCLACALIEVLGEGRRDEALEIAARIAVGARERFGWHNFEPS